METYNIFWRNVKWRFQNPITIVMTLLQPLIWLVLYSSIFANSMDGNYTAFILAGILVLVVFTSAGNSGISNYTSKMDGSFYRIHISPVRRSSIVMGHVLDAAVMSFIEIAVLLLISLLMSVHIASGIVGLVLIASLLFTTVFLMASLSYLVSLLLPDENVFFTLMTTFILPVFFVSTALIPFDNIPGSMQPVVAANPFTHVINSLRSLILTPTIDWQQYGLAVGLMLALGVVFFMLSVRQLKRDN
jgi:ABC-2 type transport system permease protein